MAWNLSFHACAKKEHTSKCDKQMGAKLDYNVRHLEERKLGLLWSYQTSFFRKLMKSRHNIKQKQICSQCSHSENTFSLPLFLAIVKILTFLVLKHTGILKSSYKKCKKCEGLFHAARKYYKSPFVCVKTRQLLTCLKETKNS